MRPIYKACAGLLIVSAAGAALAQDASLDTDDEKFSYAMGYSIGNQVLGQFGAENIQFDVEVFVRAISDALKQEAPALSPDEMQAVVMARREQEMQAQRARAEDAKAAGEAFLAENGEREGVVTTDSGLQYEVLTEGDGGQPTVKDTVVVHYRGTLLDGTEFDSSYGRDAPATFPLEGIIKGWQEALQLMKTGGKWKVFIPSELAYGASGAGGRIGPHETLIFEIELLEIK